jgi:hypothetical protein
MTRKIFGALAVLALLFAGSLTMAGSASATAQGCTLAPSGYVCNTTYGSGARVDKVVAIRSRSVSAGFICNYSADVSVQDPWGRSVWYRHLSHEGCTALRATLTFPVNRTFYCGYVTSVAWFESGVRQGGYANINLC